MEDPPKLDDEEVDEVTEKDMILRDELPPILLIQLGRDVGIGRKDMTRIPVSPTLNLNHKSYKLYGVVRHHGRNLQSGHYTAHIRNQNKWFLANDNNRIKEISLQDLVDDRDAYILFYERQDS